VLSLVKPMTKVTPEMAAGEFPKGTASDCPETGLAEWTVCTRCPYLCIQVHLHARVLIAPMFQSVKHHRLHCLNQRKERKGSSKGSR
jgi:hypothetical protein